MSFDLNKQFKNLMIKLGDEIAEKIENFGIETEFQEPITGDKFKEIYNEVVINSLKETKSKKESKEPKVKKEIAEDLKCSAMNAKNENCKNKKIKDNEFCRIHSKNIKKEVIEEEIL